METNKSKGKVTKAQVTVGSDIFEALKDADTHQWYVNHYFQFAGSTDTRRNTVADELPEMQAKTVAALLRSVQSQLDFIRTAFPAIGCVRLTSEPY